MAYDPPAWIRQFDGPPQTGSEWTTCTNEPPAGWRPFSDDSAWNTPIPASPTVHPDSAAIVDHLVNVRGGPIDRYIGVGGTEEDFDHPVYWANDGDPIERVKPAQVAHDCSYLGKNRITSSHNRLLPVPPEAVSAGGNDHSLTVACGDNYWDFWYGREYDMGEGRIGCTWAGHTPVDGKGDMVDGFGCTAADVPLIAGRIRRVEMEAGHIPHAIFMVSRWVRWYEHVYPALGTATYALDVPSTPGSPEDLRWPMTGARFYLSYTEAEINALAVPTWKKTILQCMREYGMIVGDTGGTAWGIQIESSGPDIAYGLPDRWQTWGAAQGLDLAEGPGGPYILPLKADVDWTRLRLVVM